MVIHDTAGPGSVVHSDYAKVKTIKCKRLLLTHTPDVFVSIKPIVRSGKTYNIRKNKVYEIVNNEEKKLIGDVWMKKFGAGFIGIKNTFGKFKVVEDSEQQLSILKRNEESKQNILFYCDLYEDINGGYYQYLSDKTKKYFIRDDNKVELIEYKKNSSFGTTIKNLRKKLEVKYLTKSNL